MQKIWHLLSNRTVMFASGWLLFASLVLAGFNWLRSPPLWAWMLLAGSLVLIAALFVWRWRRDQHGASRSGDPAQAPAAIRKSVRDAIATIKGSKLGQLSGRAALYELPWYMVIGNAASGKSMAIANSGLHFPLADGKIASGPAPTGHCDWLLTTEAILLDTAGRYAMADGDRAEWFDLLAQLKKYRKKAPLNGIIIAVSLAELRTDDAQFAATLAKQLRQRLQELSERLEVHAPVYLMFTKADLISGFGEFFQDAPRHERQRAWGATLPYSLNMTGTELLKQFDGHFDVLYSGLKDLSAASMASSGAHMAPGEFTFPLEFLSLKAPLRAFIATLFEENPFQFQQVFRGFYFTSARQAGASAPAASQRVAQRFDIDLKPAVHAQAHTNGGNDFFLLDLFRKVIFADQTLVRQYASPGKLRLRYGAFFCATALVGVMLGGWSWSYQNNRQLVANVMADLDKVVKVQAQRTDLESRFEAMQILQARIEQLQAYRRQRPLSLRLGLYQGDLIEEKIRREYFLGIREIMLKPVGQSLESFLGVLTAGPGNTEDAYNALKTYLMLGERSRAEAGHLNDQLARFWRAWLDANRGAMRREQTIRYAESTISFYLTQVQSPEWPTLDIKLALVEQSREVLRKVVRGLPARERVYADVRARAATRFASVTVARIVGEQDKELVLGSHAIPGSFTREAWEGFVQDAFHNAANHELHSTDWVLNTVSKDDLSMEGSPEQIQKALVDLYKNDYIKEWQKFLQGVTIRELRNFDDAAGAMNRLGDPQLSPVEKLVSAVYEQTSWDGPVSPGAAPARAERELHDWFREAVLRQAPAQGGIRSAAPAGPIGREFSGLARLVAPGDKGASLMRGYMEHLSKLRGRFHTIKNQGDPGPGAKQLMQQTLDGTGSELADALKYVDEQMLTGMTDAQKLALRPILVRPLMQTFAVIVKPAEAEIDKVWAAQVLVPFRQGLALKYPFAAESGAEASDEEIAQVFGPQGAIAKFFDTTIGPLVVRRGDALSAKTWANIGIGLAHPVITSFPGWIAPLSAGGMGNPVASAAPDDDAESMFELQAVGASGASEFTIELDGQTLRWKGQPQPWVRMTWPNRHGVPGSRISAITAAGSSTVLLDEPGHLGLKKMVAAARRKRKYGAVFELSWENVGVTVRANMKIIETGKRPAQARADQGFKRLRLPDTLIDTAPAVAAQ
ncbi:MAG TPA: type VI secretion system membrane subunit TssM [Telluria sp.]|jgi:type VI secretion system protein ImpL